MKTNCDLVNWAACFQLCLFVQFIASNSSEASPPSSSMEKTVITAFEATADGWSCDEVLLDDVRRANFLERCRSLDSTGTESDWCEALLHVRKSGGQLPKSTKRDNRESERLDAVAEIAARQLQDQFDAHTDRILVDPKMRAAFDAFGKQIAPSAEAYQLRKAALRLRKTRKLEPELVARVTDWKREIREMPISVVRSDLDSIPRRPGVYLFRDASGYLYIGQAQDLRVRLGQHVEQSDREALANYLTARNALIDTAHAEVTVEIHIFNMDSPGEGERTRRAYESELIRSRKPRLNLAP